MKKETDGRFKKFGTVPFTATTRVNDFITHLEAGQVTGTKCNSCGKKYFPPRADCSSCLSSQMTWFPLEKKGTLATYSTLKYGPHGFEGDLPYTIAVVDFGEFKAFGRIAAEVPVSGLAIGMELTPTVNRLPNGQLNYVFQKS